MIVRISGNSERKINNRNGSDRFEARLTDGGWVVFDTCLEQVVSLEGRHLERLTDTAARAKGT